MMGLLRRLRQSHHILFELVVRVLLSVIFVHLEKATPFKRMIHQDEIWLYRNPITADYVPFRYLWVVVVFLPLTVFILHGLLTRNRNEVVNAILGFTLALPLNGVLTNSVKLIVGRPRPDFFWRCFPNGEMNSDMECTGLPKLVAEGRKSFPSGHSSFSFVSMGFLSLFLFARLHVFTERARGSSWRLLLSILPLFAALLVALSRTCDYHHHWQDVVVGSMLGMAVATLCYRQYFPPSATRQKSLRRDLTESDLLHILELASETIKSGRVGIADAAATDEETKLMAPELKTSIKWI